MQKNKEIITVNNIIGQGLAVVGDSYRILVSGEQTGGEYAVIDMLIPPGGGSSPHSHKDMQEIFYVVEGEIEFNMDGCKYKARKGSFVHIPLGDKMHCFKNLTDNIAHLFCTVIPAGLDALFQEIGKPLEAGIFWPPQDSTEENLKTL